LFRLYEKARSAFRHPVTQQTRKIGLRRLTNAAVAKLEQKLIRPRPWGWPITAVIEPTNICNLQCPLCPTGVRKPGRKKGMLSWDLLKKFTDELGPYLWEVELNNWGESTLHHQLPEIIASLKGYGIHVSLSSNLVQAKPEILRGLITSGLDYLVISTDGASPETYAQYRRGGNFQEVCDHVQQLVALKKELAAANPFVSMKFLVFKHNQHEMKEFQNLAWRLGADRVQFTQPYIEKEVRKQWASDLPEFNRYASSEYGETGIAPCHWLWYGVTLNWDGTISPCCGGNSYHPELDFGSILDNTFREIWWNKHYQAARSRFNLRTRPSVDFKVACDDCDYLKAYFQHHRTQP